jgi:hypothetical protein
VEGCLELDSNRTEADGQYTCRQNRGMAMMLTLLVACLLIYKRDLPEWLYLRGPSRRARGGLEGAPKNESSHSSTTS